MDLSNNYEWCLKRITVCLIKQFVQREYVSLSRVKHIVVNMHHIIFYFSDFPFFLVDCDVL